MLDKSWYTYFLKASLVVIIVLCCSFTIFSQESEANQHGKFLIGFSTGYINFSGDVGLQDYPPPFSNRLGYSIYLSKSITPYLGLTLDLFSGKVVGDEMRQTTNLNFRTGLFSQSIKLDYNFHQLMKNSRAGKYFQPYIALGLQSLIFHTKGDLLDTQGRTYFYWSDGTIRDADENSQNAEDATLIERDYNYESELRDADLDGFGRYSQFTFALPFEAGIDWHIFPNFNARMAFAFNYTFTDLIDNITAKSLGNRQGQSGNDHFMFISFGLNYNLTSIKSKRDKPPRDRKNKKEKKRKKEKIHLVADTISKPRKEHTRVTAIADEKTWSDTIQDHEIPDSPKMEEDEITPASSDSAITIQPVDANEIENEFPLKDVHSNLPGQFHYADLNRNGHIEAEEVYHFIDLALDDHPEHTVQSVNDLIDYFFDQE